MKAIFLFELQQVSMFAREEEPAWEVNILQKVNYELIIYLGLY